MRGVHLQKKMSQLHKKYSYTDNEDKWCFFSEFLCSSCLCGKENSPQGIKRTQWIYIAPKWITCLRLWYIWYDVRRVCMEVFLRIKSAKPLCLHC